VSAYKAARGVVDEDSVRHAKRVYGTNAFVIPLPTFYDLYLEQVQAPMFVFQMFCILLFCLDEYWYVNRHHTVWPLPPPRGILPTIYFRATIASIALLSDSCNPMPCAHILSSFPGT